MKWLDIIPGALSAVGEYFKRKHDLRMKKLELKYQVIEAETTARIAMEARKVEGLFNWELLSIQNSGWKDEYMTLLLTGILLATFVPPLQPYVAQGFIILEQDTPYWFQMCLLIVVGSAFGVRMFDSFRKVLATRKVSEQAALEKTSAHVN